MNDKFFDLKREKQDRMINAGLKIFARYGYRHATTDEIVKEAGISKGLLFHYFGNKVGMYVFLMDYSVRFLLLEMSRRVDKEEKDFFIIIRQTEDAALSVLRNYPYMQAFLEKAFEEICLEALEESEEQKEAYLNQMEKYYAQGSESSVREGISLSRIKNMYKYMRRGILTENLALDTLQPEMMHVQICTCLTTLKELCK
ncbi:MAG: TetR/AcrR family transcriptional regulator [Lachnospiraceae bacterium]|nr:TetR/AcrR family transcriptional regulator [Lachnospiraceae bacterium]